MRAVNNHLRAMSSVCHSFFIEPKNTAFSFRALEFFCFVCVFKEQGEICACSITPQFFVFFTRLLLDFHRRSNRDLTRIHGLNERIHANDSADCIRFFYQLIRNANEFNEVDFWAKDGFRVCVYTIFVSVFSPVTLCAYSDSLLCNHNSTWACAGI